MKAGFVVKIRVNPRDCLSILDVIQSSKLDSEGMSFPAITSLTLSCMLEALRKQKVIPLNDGFDYDKRMQPYTGGRSSYDKRVLTEAIYVGAAMGLHAPDLPRPIDPETRAALLEEYRELDNVFMAHTPQQRERYKELREVFERLG